LSGNVLITRGSGIARLAGSTTLFDADVLQELMVCDLVFRVAFNEKSRVKPAYVAEVLRTSHLRRQIEERRTGATSMMQKTTKSGLNRQRAPVKGLAKPNGS